MSGAEAAPTAPVTPPPEPSPEPVTPEGSDRSRWSSVRQRLRQDLVTEVCIAAWLAMSVLSLWLRIRLPILVAPDSYDDLLVLRQAGHLQSTGWLGPFDQLTLAKGPAYPAFVATMDRLGLSLKAGEHLTQLLAATAVAVCVWVLKRRPVVATVAYAVLVFDPVSFSATDARPLRDGWYASLTVLVVCCCFLAALGVTRRVPYALAVGAAVVGGVAAAAFWMTREEGAWILPALVVVVAGSPLLVALARWRAARRTPARAVLRPAARLAVALGVLLLVAAVPLLGVLRTNDHRYGSALTNDMSAGTFPRAYADWTRVEAGTRRAWVPITREQRLAAYAVSPAAQELQPFLEAPDNAWRDLGCRTMPATCGDIPGAFAVWALRDAAVAAGEFGTEPRGQAFFGRLSAEIDSACADERLRCTARLPTALQTIQRTTPTELAASMGRALGDVLRPAAGFTDVLGGSPTLTPAQRQLAVSLIREMPATATESSDQVTDFEGQLGPYDLLASVYRLLLPLLAGLAVAGTVAALWLRPRLPRLLLAVLTTGLALGAVCRLFVVAVLDTTEYPADGVRYNLPTRSLLMAFGVAGTALLVEALVVLVQRVRARRDVAAAGPPADS